MGGSGWAILAFVIKDGPPLPTLGEPDCRSSMVQLPKSRGIFAAPCIVDLVVTAHDRGNTIDSCTAIDYLITSCRSSMIQLPKSRGIFAAPCIVDLVVTAHDRGNTIDSCTAIDYLITSELHRQACACRQLKAKRTYFLCKMGTSCQPSPKYADVTLL